MDLYAKILDIELGETIQDDGKEAADLAVDCARGVLIKLGWQPQDVRVLLYGTQSPKFLTPSTASYLFKELEMSYDCLAYDIDLGSTAFTKGMQLLSLLLSSFGLGEKGLLLLGDDSVNTLGVEGKSSVAAAVAVESTNEPGFTIYTKTYSDYYHSIYKFSVDSPVEINEEKLIELKPRIEEMYTSVNDVIENKSGDEMVFCTNCIDLIDDSIKNDVENKNGKIVSFSHNNFTTSAVPLLLQTFDWKACGNLIIFEIGAGVDTSIARIY